MMRDVVRPMLVCTGFLLALCCGVYPVVVTGAARALFAEQSRGGLLTVRGRVRGAALLGQTFADPAAHPAYFWGRPSAASVDARTGLLVSGASNLGPTSESLREAVRARVAALRATGVRGAIPVDLVTASASGLDPHISVAAAWVQAPRVARARRIDEARVRALIEQYTERPALGLFGEPAVHVLRLNLALDDEAG